MGKIILSNAAISDLSSIAYYTVENWGLRQSRIYRDGLNETFKAILKDSYLGKKVFDYYPNLRSIPYESHIIFYLPTESDILIVRVLGQNMDSGKHLF